MAYPLTTRGYLMGFTTIDADTVTADSFVGNLTGNVAGNVTGNLTGNVTSSGTSNLATISNTTALNLSGTVTKSATSPAQWTGNQTDYAGFGSTPVSRVSSDASRNIYSRTGSSLQFQWIVNVGAQNIVFVHDDGATGTANLRFSLKGAANYTLAPGAWIGCYYDATTARWRLTQP